MYRNGFQAHAHFIILWIGKTNKRLLGNFRSPSAILIIEGDYMNKEYFRKENENELDYAMRLISKKKEERVDD